MSLLSRLLAVGLDRAGKIGGIVICRLLGRGTSSMQALEIRSGTQRLRSVASQEMRAYNRQPATHLPLERLCCVAGQ